MKNALLLIDLQIDFLAEDGRLPVAAADAARVIAVANSMVALFAERHWPIIVIYNQFRKSDVIGNFFRKYAALEGSKGGEIDPRVIVPVARSFAKAKSSAFTNPAFSAYLKTAGIGQVVICGVYSDGCVRATAFDAMKAELDTVVLADGVASGSKARNKWALAYLRKRGVASLTSAEYLAKQPLAGDGQAPDRCRGNHA